MFNDLKSHFEKLSTNIKNTLARGSLNSITNAPTATAQVQLMNNEAYDGLEFPQDYGVISNPPKGSQVIAAFFGGNRDHGTILKAFHPGFAPKTLASGEVALYHQSGTIVHLKQDGSVAITSTTGMAITTPTLTLTGNLQVTGDIIDNSGSNAHTMSNMRTIYNEHVHSSPGTNTPTPTQ